MFGSKAAKQREEALNLLSQIEQNTSGTENAVSDLLNIALEEQAEKAQRQALRRA